MNSTNNKPCPGRISTQVILFIYFALNVICASEHVIYLYFDLQQVWRDERKPTKVSANLTPDHVGHDVIQRTDLLSHFPTVSFSDCEYKNPIYNSSTEQLHRT